MWLEDEGCQGIVELAWRHDFRGRPVDRAEGKIKHCQALLTWWSQVTFGKVTKALIEKKKKIKTSKGGGNARWING